MKQANVLSNKRAFDFTHDGRWFMHAYFSPIDENAPARCKYCNSIAVVPRKDFYECADCDSYLGLVSAEKKELALERYNRLYDNATYKEFQDWAIWTYGSSYVYAANLLTDAAIELCCIACKENPSERFEGSVKKLSEHLKHQGVSLNFAAIIHLRNFHPDALEIFFGRAK